MHPRSPYATYLDFKQLARDCPELAQYVNENSNIDFNNPAAVRELAKSLLYRDFNLTVELPEDRLCPMIPNRLDYILFLQDLLDYTSSDLTPQTPPDIPITGLDIGTGASAIYPLLSVRSRPTWRMHGTDIDSHSLSFAARNITLNSLSPNITLHHTTVDAPLIPRHILPLSFTMTNPPFHSSTASLAASYAFKSTPPSAVCTGTETEMVYVPSGELGFARRILQESLELREKVEWYTTLLGKLASVPALCSELKAAGVENVVVTELMQGSTKRWVVAWSFGARRGLWMEGGASLKGYAPVRCEVRYVASGGVEETVKVVRELMDGIDVLRREEKEREVYVEVARNSWSRAMRRAKAMGRAMEDEGGEVKLAVLITVGSLGGKGEVLIRWKEGRDAVMFESFCGTVKRAVQVKA